MSSNSSIPIGPVSNEADLFALFQAIWQQKRIILAVSVLCGLTAMGYAYFATPEYQVSSVLRPAAINELDALNRSGVYTLPPSEALLKVDNNILKLDSAISATAKLINQPNNPTFSIDETIAQLEAFNSKLIIQTLFFTGDYKGQHIDNTTEIEVVAWLEALKRIRPQQVMIYSLDRATPAQNLHKADSETLSTIAKRVEALGIETQVTF